jgi:chromosome segregation ATPase
MAPTSKEDMMKELNLSKIREQLNLYWDDILTCEDQKNKLKEALNEKDKLKKVIDHLKEELRKKQTEIHDLNVEIGKLKKCKENPCESCQDELKRCEKELKRCQDDLKCCENRPPQYIPQYVTQYVYQPVYQYIYQPVYLSTYNSFLQNLGRKIK